MVNKLTLSELNEQIKDALIDAFPTSVWIVAEISELKENRSGHCYLELIEKEGDEIIARSRATIWSYTYRMLKPYFETTTGQLFNHGIKILVQVTLEFHSSFGLSLNIKDIDPTYTVGDMALQRKEIIDRLQHEGVFEMNKELELPQVPQRIAVISSATAAGYQDFMSQLKSNEYDFVFYTKLFEAYMQGTEAVSSIINALERIYKYEDFFDAVVIIRGGGATADLSSFDNYDLALNITQFPLPVITGIGHEKDDTIVDLVAHTRLKTPTAVAEFFVGGVVRYFERLVELENGIVQYVKESIDFQKEKLERITEGMNYRVSGFLKEKQIQLSKKANELQQVTSEYSFNKQYDLNNLKRDFESTLNIRFIEADNNIIHKKRLLKHAVNKAVVKEEAALKYSQELFKNTIKQYIFKEQERIHLNQNAIRLLNLDNVLNRGFTITLKEGKIVKSVKQLSLNDELETQFADGKVKSKIEVIKGK